MEFLSTSYYLVASALPLPSSHQCDLLCYLTSQFFRSHNPASRYLEGLCTRNNHQLPNMTPDKPTIHCHDKIIPSLWEALSTSCPNIIYDFKCCLIYGWNSPSSEERLSNLLGMFLGNGGKGEMRSVITPEAFTAFMQNSKLEHYQKKRKKNLTQTTLIW